MIEFENISSNWNTVIGRVLPTIFLSVSILSCLIIILTFHQYERLRLYTGKLILLINIISLPFNSLLMAGLYYPSFNSSRKFDEKHSEESWCKSLGIIFNMILLLLFLLNTFLIHNLICSVISRENTFPKRFKKYLLVAGTLAMGSSALVGFSDAAGRGPLGFCWMRGDRWVARIHEIFFLFAVIFLLLGLIFVFLRERERSSSFMNKYEEGMAEKMRTNFIKFNMAYISVFLVAWLPTGIIGFIDIILTENDYYMQGSVWASFKCINLYLISLFSFGNLIVRVKEPFIQTSLKRTFYTLMNREETNNLSKYEGKEENLLKPNEILNRNSTWGDWEVSGNDTTVKITDDLNPTALAKQPSDKKQKKEEDPMGVSLQVKQSLNFRSQLGIDTYNKKNNCDRYMNKDNKFYVL